MNGEISMIEYATRPSVSTVQTAVINDPDAFGCCSRYRECSDVGKCVNSNEDLSGHCIYRNNLNDGRVFYGKKADDFDVSEYEQLRQRVEALPKDARLALDNLLIDFCEYNYGAEYAVTRNMWIPQLSSVGLFVFTPFNPETLATQSLISYAGKAYVDFMEKAKEQREAVKNEIKKAKRLGDSERIAVLERELEELKKWSYPNQKKTVLMWYRSEATDMWDSLNNNYMNVYFPVNKARYAEELYCDTLLSTAENRVYELSPLAQDGLTLMADSEEEELRRVKVSRGYSREEKERRISEIEQRRAVRAAERAANAEAKRNTVSAPQKRGDA